MDTRDEYVGRAARILAMLAYLHDEVDHLARLSRNELVRLYEPRTNQRIRNRSADRDKAEYLQLDLRGIAYNLRTGLLMLESTVTPEVEALSRRISVSFSIISSEEDEGE